MSVSRRTKARLLVVASMVAPLLGAQAIRLMGAGGPSSSAAYVGPAPITPVIAPGSLRVPEPTAEQTRALQWLALRSSDRAVRCPMEQPTAPPLPPPPINEDPPPTQVPTTTIGPDPLTTLTVTTIVARAQGNMARINGKLYAVGSVPLKGWTITAIDPDNGFVELTGAEGKAVKLLLKRPDPTHQ